MWRWLLCSKNNIHKDERQYLMNLVQKLVYANKETELNTECQTFMDNLIVKRYPNFILHMQITGYVERSGQYALEKEKPCEGSTPIITLNLGYGY